MASGKRCYVLGAGFSKPFGLPLARELTPLAFCAAYPCGDGVHAPMRDRYRQYIKHFFPRCELDDGKPSSWPDFEELMTVIDEDEDYRMAYEGETPPNESSSSPVHLREVLLKRMANGLCEKGLELSDEDGVTVQEFVTHVQEGQHSIVSFNWDLLIENAAQYLGLAISRCENEAEGLQLAKPHGSIDLAEMHEDEFRQRKARVVNLFGLVEFSLRDSRIVLRAEDPLSAQNRIIAPFSTGELLIVPPNLRKSYSSQWIRSQWCRAMDMLRDAEEVFVIGYSLPPADFRPRVLLSSGSTADKRSRPITIVAPDADELAGHYKEYVSGDVNAIEKSWVDWFKLHK